MGPGFTAPEREIIGIGHLAMGRLLRLDQLIGDALALAIGDRFLLAVEMKGELLLHVARRGPAHQRLDGAGLLWLVFEPPLIGLGPTRLHRVFRGLKNTSGHGWSALWKVVDARARNVQDRSQPSLGTWIGDSRPGCCVAAGIVMMLRCD